jgi:hypothetical protein
MLCDASKKISSMRNHVGGHILKRDRGVSETKKLKQEVCRFLLVCKMLLILVQVGAEPCGFCGLDGCRTVVRYGNDAKTTVLSSCPYFASNMRYSSAQTWSKSTPCTNVPIQCRMCAPNASGQCPSVWKYNFLYHLHAAHAAEDGGLPERIDTGVWADMFLREREESALGIDQALTSSYRAQHNIPDSDGIQAIADGPKRARSDSSALEQNPVTQKARYPKPEIPE